VKNAILRARRLRLVLGVKDLGLGLGFGLGLGSFALICRARAGNNTAVDSFFTMSVAHGK